jgi:hypothetical protein
MQREKKRGYSRSAKGQRADASGASVAHEYDFFVTQERGETSEDALDEGPLRRKDIKRERNNKSRTFFLSD